MYGDGANSSRRRAAAALVSLAVNGVIVAALVWGLGVAGEPRDPASDTALTTLELQPPPPPPPERPERSQDAEPKPEGLAGPEGEALPVEAPAAAISLAPKPAAPVAGEGRSVDAGAGSQGEGSGSGTQGSGGGGGTGIGAGAPAVRIAGALRDSDYPRDAESAGIAGTVGISFRVRTDGRVDRCTVERSSGHPPIDELTCRLFTQRYRFRPATDGAGTPVETTLRTSFTWGTRRRR